MNKYYTAQGLNLALRVTVAGGQMAGVAVNGQLMDRTGDGHYKFDLGPSHLWKGHRLNIVATVAQTNTQRSEASVTASLFHRIPRDENGKPTLHWPEPNRPRDKKDFRATEAFGADKKAALYVDVSFR